VEAHVDPQPAQANAGPDIPYLEVWEIDGWDELSVSDANVDLDELAKLSRDY
jgi:hypothetical protein